MLTLQYISVSSFGREEGVMGGREEGRGGGGGGGRGREGIVLP